MLKPDCVLKHYTLHLTGIHLPKCLESAIVRVLKGPHLEATLMSRVLVLVFFPHFISFTAKSFLLSLHDYLIEGQERSIFDVIGINPEKLQICFYKPSPFPPGIN